MMPIRGKTHLMEERSERILKSFLDPWIVAKIEPDYGIDYLVTVAEENSKVTPMEFYVQLKSMKKVKKNSYQYDKEHLTYFSGHLKPIFLVLCNLETDKLFWINIRGKISEIEKRKPDWKNSKQKSFSLSFNKDDILTKEQILHSFSNTLDEIIVKEALNRPWDSGLGHIKNNPDELKEIIERGQNKVESQLFHLSQLEVVRGNFDRSQNRLIEIIKNDKRNKTHFEALLSLLRTFELQYQDQTEEFDKYFSQAEELVENFNEKYHKVQLNLIKLQKKIDLNNSRIFECIFILENNKTQFLPSLRIKNELIHQFIIRHELEKN
jgi:DNA-binding ferritin-like protein (Dps family)